MVKDFNKIYGRVDDWIELYQFLKENDYNFIKFLYRCPAVFVDYDSPIYKLTKDSALFLRRNCNIYFIRDAAEYYLNTKNIDTQ